MARKIVYLINPISGTKDKAELKELIKRKTKEAGISFEIMDTDKTGKYEVLKNKISKDGVTDVVVCGGDGTVSAVSAALLNIEINIGIVPMGSGNGLALAANIPAAPVKALEIVFNGKASFIDGFYINDDFSCMLCGLGFDAQVAHDFAKQKKRGLQTYIKVSAINYFKANPYNFSIQSKEKSFDTSAWFICIANSNQFGNNMKIAPKASLSDGLLDIVIVKKMNKLMLPLSVLAQFAGINALQNVNDYSDKKNIIYFQTPSLTIKNLSAAPFHIDGDPKDSAKEFKVKVVRNAIKLIQPS
ncbi:MAG: YegS/Rv2252/BmrU family lipid kinase [Sphingobacteriales bacterium]|nr:YegS/Rv2252/BmrU family lipid kinase [Sphingobacteriales bacterium]MBI3717397.1 YegS/Rv2252/BmrU family lipid kinase [Sphingobacteriales bacterium]